jgi:hypothetical protein
VEGATSVKMLTWEESFERLIHGVRACEVAPMWRMLMIEATAMAIMYFCTPVRARWPLLLFRLFCRSLLRSAGEIQMRMLCEASCAIKRTSTHQYRISVASAITHASTCHAAVLVTGCFDSGVHSGSQPSSTLHQRNEGAYDNFAAASCGMSCSALHEQDQRV